MVLQNDNIPGQTLSHLHVHAIPRSPDDGFILADPARLEISFEVRAQQVAQNREVLARR